MAALSVKTHTDPSDVSRVPGGFQLCARLHLFSVWWPPDALPGETDVTHPITQAVSVM